jgi:hypothetical protein
MADSPNRILSFVIEKFISELLMLGGRISTLNCRASRIILLILPALSLWRFNMALKKAVL